MHLQFIKSAELLGGTIVLEDKLVKETYLDVGVTKGDHD